MASFTPAPPPTTKLGRYRQLSPRAGIHVSPICLGGMSVGDKWNALFGDMNKEESFKLLDAYFDAGGNFIDTANIYHDGTSEEFIGEWMKKRGIRDQIILCTKYTNISRPGDEKILQRINYVGNSAKSLKLSLDASLQRLQTDYIDIFYMHYWDQHTPIEEVMDALHNLVVSGKVLYLGVSDTAAWWVSKANQYARSHGKTPFIVYQAMYSVLTRDAERDIIPMCAHEGMGLTAFGVLGSGRIRSSEEEKRRREKGEEGRKDPSKPWERSDEEIKVCDGLEVVAKNVGIKDITAIAIAYVMHKAPFVFPIIGGRKVEQLHTNIKALDVKLSPEQIKYIDGLKGFDVGFPHNLIGAPGDYAGLLRMNAIIDAAPLLQPIAPAENLQNPILQAQ